MNNNNDNYELRAISTNEKCALLRGIGSIYLERVQEFSMVDDLVNRYHK